MLKTMLATILTINTATAAVAGTSSAGTITDILYMQNGVLIFNTSGSHSGAPNCATQPMRWALNATTAGGKTQAAGIIAAHAAGKSIEVYGSNNCVAWGDTETVDYFRVAS